MTSPPVAPNSTSNDIVLRRLAGLCPIEDTIADLIRRSCSYQDHGAGLSLIRDRDPLKPHFLISGWAARVRWLADGRRQIISFILPGDSIGLCERRQPLALAPVMALTRLTTLDAMAVQKALAEPERYPGLSQAVHVAAALDEASLMDQVVRVGRQSAYERITHLLLELGHRLERVGLGSCEDFPCPLTQEMMADAMGLSVVHMNRTLQQLRREGLLDLGHGQARLRNLELLKAIADFQIPQPSAWSG